MIDNHLIENRHIRVFISSTFQDMQGERDYLMKHTFPMLRKLASERDVTLTEIDLRWGITEEESLSGKVVEICLREIENSVPFFIGIIGNRYGWVPKEEELGENVTERYPEVKDYVNRQLSVTEMEMQFGVLERKEDMNAYFYIKEEEEGKEIDNLEMLERLKKAVGYSRYPSSSYSTVEDLAQQVEQAFTALLDKLFPVGNISELEKERIGQRSIMRQLCQNYIEDERNFQAIDQWLDDWDSHQLVVTGASGLGKSALIANWLKEKLSDNNRDYNIIYHFTGNGGSECSHERIKSFLCEEVADTYGWKETDDKDISKISATSSGMSDEKEDKLDQLFISVAAEADKPLLIVLDAVNQIVDNDNAKLLNWLPVLPRKVKILFSTLEDDRTMQVFKNRNYPIFTLQPLSTEHRKKLITEYLHKLYGKKLTEQLVERIAGDRQCENTLVLKTLLDELINYGIYETLGDRVEYYLSQETIEDFYQALLQSYEEEFGKSFVCHALSLIAVSKNGLSEDEILAILNHGYAEDNLRVTRLQWSQFLFAFMSHTITKNGIITFSHSYILNAVEERYSKSDNQHEHTCREEIVRLMDGQETDLAFAERAWQLFNLKDYKRLHDFLLNIKVFDSLYKSDEYALGQYWRELIAKGYKLSDYKPLLKEAKILLCYNVSEFCRNIMADYNTAEYASLQSIEKAEELYGKESKELAAAYNILGNVYTNLGEYPKALEYNLKSLDIIKQVFGSVHIVTASCYNTIGVVYDSIGKYSKALEYYQKSLEIKVQFHGMNHPDVAATYNNIGVVYTNLGEYLKALECHLKSVEIKEKVLGVEHIDTAVSYDNIGIVYIRLDKYPQALEYCQKALEIKKDVLGMNHPDVAATYNNIGLVYDSLCDYSKSLGYHHKALEIREQILGMKHIDTAVSYDNIGIVYIRLDEYPQALEYCQKALEIKKYVLGMNHPDIAATYNNIGVVFASLGKYLKALEYFQKTLDIREQIFGKNHSNTATSYNIIGRVYEKLGEYSNALEYYHKALEIREQVLGLEHHDTADSYEDIGNIHYRLGEYAKSLEFHQKALTIRDKVLGAEHPDTLASKTNIDLVSLSIENDSKMLEYYHKDLEKKEQLLGMEHPDTVDSYEQIGFVYTIHGDYSKALEYYQKALVIQKKVFGDEHPDTVYSYEDIGNVFTHLGNYPKAIEHFEKALEIRRAVLPADDPAIQQTLEYIEEIKKLINDK